MTSSATSVRRTVSKAGSVRVGGENWSPTMGGPRAWPLGFRYVKRHPHWKPSTRTQTAGVVLVRSTIFSARTEKKNTMATMMTGMMV